MAIAILGACRTSELVHLTNDDVEILEGNKLFITLRTTKVNEEDRQFMITGELANIVMKYKKLRPMNASTNRFFLRFQNGICRNQVTGKNMLSQTPCRIATFLNLPEPTRYTGNQRNESNNLCTFGNYDCITPSFYI